MKAHLPVIAIATIGIAGAYLHASGGSSIAPAAVRVAAGPDPAIPRGIPIILPIENDARRLLSTTPRHIEWVAAPMDKGMVLAFVVSPERSDRAPVVLVTVQNRGASDWVRALADQVAAAGFVAVAPDVLTGLGANGGDSDSFRGPAAVTQALAALGPHEIAHRIEAVRMFAVASAASTGVSARLDLDPEAGTVHATVNSPSSGTAESFALSSDGWLQALVWLRDQTNDHPVYVASQQVNEHAQHFAMLAQAARGQGETGQPGQAGANTSYAQKRPDLPADFYTAKATVDASKLSKEWIDLPVGDVKMRTWVEYPAGSGKAGAVIVMQHGTGMDAWVRGVVDQLAQSGFIAIAPDVWAGSAPDGGGIDAFEFIDDAMKAAAKITPDETMRRFKAARDYILKQPRSNGKTASLGFCAGGGNAFRFAGEVPELNGAVVFYGTPPDEPIMAKIKAPVVGFYGENDARVTSTVEPTIANMKRLGKLYEPHVYPKTTHSFVLFQEVAGNPAAVNDAWPRAIAFLKKQLM